MTSSLRFFLDGFQSHEDVDALIYHDKKTTYRQLLDSIQRFTHQFEIAGIKSGDVVMLQSDLSPDAVAALFALAQIGAIIVPLVPLDADKMSQRAEVAQWQWHLSVQAKQTVSIKMVAKNSHHPLYEELRHIQHPGLVLFSSGSSGQCKATLHDLERLLSKFHNRHRSPRTLAFLLFDHIGGLDVLFYVLSGGGTLIAIENRNPDAVLTAVEQHGVQLLPTSPTFLNLMLLSEAHSRHSLESLATITYGTESMPEATLHALHESLPKVRLVQTYGMSELGALRTKSKSSDSLWLKFSGEGMETRIVEGMLQVKSRTTMVGYLNAPSPFTEDGWFITGDKVEVRGDYMRILGRESQIINVGGEKVYPAEVENVILQVPEVAQVSVFGQAHPLTGQIVCAKVRPHEIINAKEFIRNIRLYCRDKLEPYKIPVRVEVVNEAQHGERYKKKRVESTINDK